MLVMADDSLSWKAAKFFARLTGKAAAGTARFAWNHRREIAKGSAAAVAAGAGMVKGSAEFAYNAGSLFYYRKQYKGLQEYIQGQSELYNMLVANNKTFFDAGVIGGVPLVDYLLHGKDVPPDVEHAYSLAYPGLAEKWSFSEAAENYSDSQMQGFLAGVKGKLFEIKYADYLNSGNLPDGYHASLADSPNQPGWDIEILGPDDSIADVLQCKACDSVSYITAAARKYPDIDIVATDEVYSQVLMHAAGEDVINSGISDAALEQTVNHASDVDYDFIGIKIPLASLALIAFSEYTVKDKNVYQKSFGFGDRGAKSMIAYTSAAIVAGITQTWWLGLIAGVGTRLIADKGRKIRMELPKLERIRQMNEQALLRAAGLVLKGKI